MKPNFLNLFMKKLTLDRVVPIIIRQHLLTHFGNYTHGFAFLAKMSEQQKDPGPRSN